MIAVVFLAFVQIISAEFRRFIEIIYPPGDVTANKITDKRLSVDERVHYFRILLYGYQVSRVLSNMCTAVNHSLVCYLYVAMNKIFRRELWSLVRCRPLRRGEVLLLRARTMSMAPAPGTPRGGLSRKSTATARAASVVKKTSVVSMLVRAASSKNRRITVTTTAAAATAETSFFRTASFQLKFLDVDGSRLSG
uniref:Uncharacterized protein n=1 Tax=Romanomermis culicivorax TaxID=13658 RepID=A0A915IJ73_ROMCU